MKKLGNLEILKLNNPFRDKSDMFYKVLVKKQKRKILLY